MIELRAVLMNFQRWIFSRPRLFLVLATVFTLAPFLNKAIHIDDPLFIWTAKWIQQHPADFFSLTVNWFGVETPMHASNFNPPGISYLLALVGTIFGWSEWVLHGTLLAVAVGAVLGVYALAQQWCNQPLMAAFLTLATPVFLVSATTLMCDVPMLALCIWSVVLWEKGITTGSYRHLLLSGVLLGVGILTKYSAVTLLPVLFILAVLRFRRLGVWLVAFVLPVVFLLGYEWWTADLYQRGLFSLAREYAAANTGLFPGGQMSKFIVSAVFIGGCLLPAAIFIPFLWRGRWPLVVCLIGVGVAMVWLSTFERIGMMVLSNGESNDGVVFQIALLATAGIHLLVLTIDELWQRRDGVTVVLALWVVGGLVFATVLNWTISARSLLPVAPAMMILLSRRIERVRPAGALWPGLSFPLVVSLLVALVVTAADAALANSARTAAREIVATHAARDHQIWFQGHWGFQYYMQDLGAFPVDFDRSAMGRGDVLVVPANASNTIFPPAEVVETTEVQEFPVLRWFGAMRLGFAGFYAADWGTLPFGIFPNPPERYYIFKLSQDLRYRSASTSSPDANTNSSPSVVATNESQTTVALTLAGVAARLQEELKPREAVVRYREALQYTPNDSSLLNNLAWILASHPDASIRNGGQAVQYAERACSLTEHRQPVLLGTLAAAYAEAGRFEDAVATAQKAIALAKASGQTELETRNAELLELYRAHKPYHEPAP